VEYDVDHCGGKEVRMKRLLRIFMISCLAFLLSGLLAWAQNQVLVIEGGTLIDGTGRNPVSNAVVVVEGTRIKAVGTKGQVSYPQNARVINAQGKTLLPGLIDSHIHFDSWMFPLFLHFGVTSVFDTANPTAWSIAQREAVEKGHIQGPRLFVTGAVVDGPAERSNMNHSTERGGYRFHARTTEEARKLTQDLIAQGVDAIKVHEGLTPELLKAVTDTARQAGVEVVGHSHNSREAILAGLKFIEHTTPVWRAIITDPAKLKEIEEQGIAYPEALMEPSQFDSLISLAVKEKVYLNATLSAQWRAANPRAKDWARRAAELAKDPALAFVPKDRLQAWEQGANAPANENPKVVELRTVAFKRVQEFVRRYAEAGGWVVPGSDTGIVPGLGLHNEMQSMVDSGMTPMQVILGATKWSAELMHREKDLGTIEAGKLADIIAVDGDPLADIQALQKASLVIKEGKVINTAFDPKFVNPLPRPVNLDRQGPDQGPQISAITPTMAREGQRGVVVEVSGAKFNPTSAIRFDTTDLRTTFVSESKLTAALDGDVLQRIGTYGVTVVNPGSGGGTSNTIYFVVNFRE
jgi:imidazolonepropionase-like amidohydrolase